MTLDECVFCSRAAGYTCIFCARKMCEFHAYSWLGRNGAMCEEHKLTFECGSEL